jgi:hypothetical protein
VTYWHLMRPGLLGGVLLAGCADPGTFVAGPALVTVTDNAGRVTVTTPNYTIDFAPTGVRMPDRFVVEGEEMFGTDPELCNKESFAGIGVFPAVNAIAGDQGTAQRSTLDHPMTGPFIAKVNVSYEVDYECGGPQTLKGQTLFTFFPTGRIVREDRGVQPSSTTLTKTANCGCQQGANPPSDLFFTSYWAFTRSDAEQVNNEGTVVTEGVDQACNIYPDRAIAISWQGQDPTTRIGPNAAASFVYDLASGVDSLPAAPRGLFSGIQVSTANGLARTECNDLLLHLADGPIMIANELLEFTGIDGIYRPKNPHPDTFDIVTDGANPVPAGFAASIDLGGATHAVVTRTPAKPDFVLVQREEGVADDKHFIFVFPDGLAPGEKITIEPRR